MTIKAETLRVKGRLANQITLYSFSMAIEKRRKVLDPQDGSPCRIPDIAKSRKGRLASKTKSRTKFYHVHDVSIWYAFQHAKAVILCMHKCTMHHQSSAEFYKQA